MAISLTPEEILRDYRVGYQSRQVSLLGRREVLTGKAKFGIFGDGKEIAQLAMARAFRPGDIRSGYYRDQTFMFAKNMLEIEAFFAQLYADPDRERDPASGGRQMNCHFATRALNDDGSWKNLSELNYSTSDSSPTSSQMPRLAGLAYASKLYRQLEALHDMKGFSNNGDEIAFGTIGNASCAEGLFWETINAVGVLQAPLLLSIWDDDYGISVHNRDQITKGNLSAVLSGFARRDSEELGYDLYTVKGWDYPTLCELYQDAAERVRREHVPAIIHVVELTQPQGHSTSGSHERYKSPERLEWEKEHDCLTRMRALVLEQGLVTEAELEIMEKEDLERVRDKQRRAWDAFMEPIRADLSTAAELSREIAQQSAHGEALEAIVRDLERVPSPLRRHTMVAVRRVLMTVRDEDLPGKQQLIAWKAKQDDLNAERYSSDLYSRSTKAAIEVAANPPLYSDASPTLNGFEILNHCFDAALKLDPRIIAFGEDVGHLGDVNQGMAGLQEKYGKLRVSDTGIRECTILGQAIGMAMRGLRPIAEIQYLDYLLFALQTLSDDLATLRYRSAGGQQAPVIVRTRGHRLEGIWHSGSPMSGILGLVRGVYVCVPRDMTRAAGFYNTLLRSDDSALVIEVLNGYRVKETLPDNIGELTNPLGVPEILRDGSDVTLVTYGACCRLALEATELLAEVGIETEVIDVQTLLPFDIHGVIGQSLRRTHRIVFVDEDVPGGATAYMLQQVIEKQRGYAWLDAEPRTLSAQEHRPAYGSDGDYWSKPNVEQVFETVYELMHEANPLRFPIFYK